jgi:hypothetical protein
LGLSPEVQAVDPNYGPTYRDCVPGIVADEQSSEEGSASDDHQRASAR